MHAPTLEQKIDALQQFLREWDANAPHMYAVMFLDQDTGSIPLSTLQIGYDQQGAFQGYRSLLDAYQLLSPQLTEAQILKIAEFQAAISEMSDGMARLGPEISGVQTTPKYKQNMAEYVPSMVNLLHQRGYIYIASGFSGADEGHASITRITYTPPDANHPNGSYRHTLYDAGGYQQIIDTPVLADGIDGRPSFLKPQVNAITEREITFNGTDIAGFIEMVADCNYTPHESMAYWKLKSKIENALGRVERVRTDAIQERGNCTVRCQRLLSYDLLEQQDADDLHHFITDVDREGQPGLKASLQTRLHHLQGLLTTTPPPLPKEIFAHLCDPDLFREYLPAESGLARAVYGTKLEKLDVELLEHLEGLLQRNGITAQIREMDGQFILCVPATQKDNVNQVLRTERDLRQIADAYHGAIQGNASYPGQHKPFSQGLTHS